MSQGWYPGMNTPDLYSKIMRPSLQRAFRDAANVMNEAQGYGRSKYPYIPLSLDQFENMMRPLVKPNMRVIDVGCGAGDKLYSWHMLEPTLYVTGIELDELMVRIANYTCPFAEVICGDAFKHDYSKYDLIYMYRPIPDERLQAKLQKFVMNSMRIGARLIVIYQAIHTGSSYRPYRFFPDLGSSPNYSDTTLRGWVKEKSYAEHAAEWHEKSLGSAKHSAVA